MEALSSRYDFEIVDVLVEGSADNDKWAWLKNNNDYHGRQKIKRSKINIQQSPPRFIKYVADLNGHYTREREENINECDEDLELKRPVDDVSTKCLINQCLQLQYDLSQTKEDQRVEEESAVSAQSQCWVQQRNSRQVAAHAFLQTVIIVLLLLLLQAMLRCQASIHSKYKLLQSKHYESHKLLCKLKRIADLDLRASLQLFFEDTKHVCFHKFKTPFEDCPGYINKPLVSRWLFSNIVRPSHKVIAVINRISIGERVEPKEAMRSETLRLATFSHFPPDKPFCIRFAQAGFYSTLKDDEVACYCCGVRISNWEETDSPIEIHKTVSPNCQFIVNNASVNVLITTEPNLLMQTKRSNNTDQENAVGFTEKDHATLAVQQHKHERCQNESLATTHNSIIFEERNVTSTIPENQNSERFPIVQESCRHTTTSSERTRLSEQPAPKYPDFQTVQERKRSFNSCQHIDVAVSDLCLAGFYYAGRGDCTRCFYCGLGLKDWQSGDDPWVEHVRFNRGCEYLRRMKGEEFVSRVRATVQFSSERTNEDIRGTTNLNQSGNFLPRTENTTVDVPGRMSEQLCAHAKIVNEMVEMGFANDLIHKAIDIVSKKAAQTTATTQTVIEEVLRLQSDVSVRAYQSGLLQDSASLPANRDTPKYTEVVTCNDDAKVKTPGIGSSENVSEFKNQKQSNNTKIGSKERQKLLQERRDLLAITYCSVCKKNENSIVFLPCGHLIACESCAPSIHNCTICKQKIIGTVRTYRA